MIKETMSEPSPFVPDDVIGYYHNRSTWEENKDENRPRALSDNKVLENLYRVQKLYYNIYSSILHKLREKYGHDEKQLEVVKSKILDRIDNKVRTTTQGEMYVQIGKYNYTGSAKEHEKYFQSTKKNFNSIIKEIAKELLSVINDNAFSEQGKSIKFDGTK